MRESERTRAVELALRGDEDSLQRLLIYYHGPLRAAVARRLPAILRRRFDPEDILQQAYVTAFKSIGSCAFDGAGGFYKWLEKIALSRLATCGRDVKRHKRDIGREETVGTGRPGDSSRSYHDLAARLCASSTTPSRRTMRREAVAAVISSLARLTKDQREAIRLRILKGMTAAEVAAQLEKSEAAVNMLTHRGLRVLRRHVDSTLL